MITPKEALQIKLGYAEKKRQQALALKDKIAAIMDERIRLDASYGGSTSEFYFGVFDEDPAVYALPEDAVLDMVAEIARENGFAVRKESTSLIVVSWDEP